MASPLKSRCCSNRFKVVVQVLHVTPVALHEPGTANLCGDQCKTLRVEVPSCFGPIVAISKLNFDEALHAVDDKV